MKRTIYILLIGLATVQGKAQGTWTMDRCIQYAVEHANDIRRQRMQNEQTAYDEKTAKMAFLPTVGAQVSGQYSWGRNIDPETNTYNTITTFNNYYSIAAEVTLFDGGRTLNAFRQARLARANSAARIEKLADERAIQVMTKFVEAIYNLKSIGLAERKLSDSKALLLKTRRLYELGEKARPDVVQMESQVAEDDYNLLRQQNEARLSLLALKSEMNFPAGDSLVLDTTVYMDKVAAETADALFESFRCGAPDVRNAQYDVENARYNYLIQRGERLPRLSLGLGISTNYYKNLSQEGRSSEAFGRQLSNNLGEYVYLSLSVPIFNPAVWRSARKAKTTWQQAQVALEETQRKLRDEISRAVIDRDGCLAEVRQMRKKVEADSVAYHLSHRKYEEGMLSTFDLHTSAQTLLQSRIRLLQMELTLGMKQRLVNYYKGRKLWTSK